MADSHSVDWAEADLLTADLQTADLQTADLQTADHVERPDVVDAGGLDIVVPDLTAPADILPPPDAAPDRYDAGNEDLFTAPDLVRQVHHVVFGAGSDPQWTGSLFDGTELVEGQGDQDVILVQEPLLTADFEDQQTGVEPEDWVGTGEDNSLAPAGFFVVGAAEGGKVLQTGATETNIHCHFAGAGSAAWQSYELSGRLRASSTGGGIGVTFYSDYPLGDRYYRLRRYNGTGSAFYLTQHGTGDLKGDVHTGVEMERNTWYHFRIQVRNEIDRTRILASIWPELRQEPSARQADAYDDDPLRLLHGTVGAWSMESGVKYWDDFRVSSLDAHHVAQGIIHSRVIDTGGLSDLTWDEVVAEIQRPGSTIISFRYRSADEVFAPDAAFVPPWQGGYGGVAGRYLQWQAFLNTTDPGRTPVLQSVTITYSGR